VRWFHLLWIGISFSQPILASTDMHIYCSREYNGEVVYDTRNGGLLRVVAAGVVKEFKGKDILIEDTRLGRIISGSPKEGVRFGIIFPHPFVVHKTGFQFKAGFLGADTKGDSRPPYYPRRTVFSEAINCTATLPVIEG
jgi:hypothetical protein